MMIRKSVLVLALFLFVLCIGRSNALATTDGLHFEVRSGDKTIRVAADPDEAVNITLADVGTLQIVPHAIDAKRTRFAITRSTSTDKTPISVVVFKNEPGRLVFGAREVEIEWLDRPNTPTVELVEFHLEFADGTETAVVVAAETGEIVRLGHDGVTLGIQLTRDGAGTLVAHVLEPDAATWRRVDEVSYGTSKTIGLKASVVTIGVHQADPSMWGEVQTSGPGIDIIDLELAVGGDVIHATTPLHSMLRLDLATGVTVGLTPVPNPVSDGIDLQVFRVLTDRGPERLQLLSTLSLETPAAMQIEGHALELRLTGSRPNHQRGVCWMDCGSSVSAHGCAIGCGGTDCCVGGCCPI